MFRNVNKFKTIIIIHKIRDEILVKCSDAFNFALRNNLGIVRQAVRSAAQYISICPMPSVICNLTLSHIYDPVE